MTPEIEESKRRLYALATNPRMRAALDPVFALRRRMSRKSGRRVRTGRRTGF